MRAKASIILLFLLAGTVLFAQGFPRVEPDPAALEYASRCGALRGYSWEDLAEISLWASGDTGITANMEKLRAAVDELLALPELPPQERERAEYVLNFVHKRFLKSYSFSQTRIDTLLSNGRYNCVSSAVLYMILARAAGLDVRGAMTKDHAFAVVYLEADGESVDVETTNPYGFDPGSRKDFQDQFGTVTGFAYVPATNYRDRASVSPIELVSLILQNRIADLEARRRFAEVIPLVVDRAALLDASGEGSGSVSGTLFGDPRHDMTSRIFNYGASLLNAGKEEECLTWAGLVMPLYGSDSRWQELVLTAVNNRVTRFHNRFATAYNRRNYEEAARILGEALEEYPDNKQLLADKMLLEL